MGFNQFEITREIRRTGKYWTGSAHGYAFILLEATGKKRKFDDTNRHVRVGEITIPQVNNLIQTSPSVAVAAKRAIAICLKKEDPAPSTMPAQVQIDPDEVQRLVNDGVKKGVADVLASLGITPEDVALLHSLKAAQGAPKKRGPGRPRKNPLPDAPATA